MHSQITYNFSIWQEKYWIVTRSRKFLLRIFFPDKREEANNAMKNQRQYLLGLQVCWLLAVPQPALAPLSTSPPSLSSLSSSRVVICLFPRIVEDTVCLVLALLVDTTIHTSRTTAAVVIIKIGLPYCSSLSSPLFLFIGLLCCLLNVSLIFSLIACLCSFNTKWSNATSSCILLKFLASYRIYQGSNFIRYSRFISASSSGSRVRSRLGNPLEEYL